jgi:metal-responsive CopG/Arc/MetJ family transcriptional regulator
LLLTLWKDQQKPLRLDPPHPKTIGWYENKTSVTLSEELLDTIDRLPDHHCNRSLFLETAAWIYIRQIQRTEPEPPDLAILNRRADYLNEEVNDALAYQAFE